MTSDRFSKKLDRWKAALLDLTARNRLLMHRESASASLKLVRPGPREIFDRLLHDDGSWRIYVKDPDASKARGEERTPDEEIELAREQVLTQRRGKKAEKACTLLMRALRAGLEEVGVHTLFLAFGMLHWQEPEMGRDREWAAPLMLVPVELERRSIRDPYRIVPAENEAQLNPALIEKLRQSYGMELPPLPEDPAEHNPHAYALQVAEQVSELEGWRVDAEAVWLDRFEFAKLAMYRDLEHNDTRYREHPIVQALTGNTSAVQPVDADEIPAPGQLDEAVPVDQMHHVLDADSSQHQAIEIVKRGGNLVIEGPPGTGKSQTIANMITELMAAGKNVLFVSEKRAALDVVWRRLDQVGLGGYCLDLHNPHVVNRKTVARELNQAWRGERPLPESPYVDLELIEKTRKRLNEYVEALHTPLGALGISPYEGYERFWRVERAPDIRFPLHNALELTGERVQALEEDLERLANHMEVLRKSENHPFRFVTQLDGSLRFREELEDEFRALVEACRELEAWCSSVEEETKLAAPKRLDEAEQYAYLLDRLTTWPGSPPPAAWFGIPDIAEALQLVKQASERGRRLVEDDRAITTRYHEDFLHERVDLEGLEQRARHRSTSFLRIFDTSYWRDRRLIISYLLPERQFDHRRMATDCARARHLKEDRAWFERHSSRLSEMLGDWFHGPESDWDAILKALHWIAERRKETHDRPIPEGLLQTVLVTGSRERFTTLARNGNARAKVLRDKLAQLTRHFPKLAEERSPLRPEEQSLTELRDFFEQRLDAGNALFEWLAFRRAEEALRGDGFEALTEAIKREARNLQADELVAAVKKRLYRLWLDAAQLKRPALTQFRGEDHERLVERFRAVDSLAPRTGAERTAKQVEQQRPGWTGYVPPGSELQILSHQASLKRGHMPVRRLLERIPRLAQGLMPCWMMSPLSVCQYLTEEHEFDVVIFDEASQVRPEDALPAIRHARQCVIVGDRQQLPPTAFFARLGTDLVDARDAYYDDEVDLTPLESVLEEASRFFPVQRLTWHYRSKDETLIAFSNRAFYDDALITFPAPYLPLAQQEDADDEPSATNTTSSSDAVVSRVATPDGGGRARIEVHTSFSAAEPETQSRNGATESGGHDNAQRSKLWGEADSSLVSNDAEEGNDADAEQTARQDAVRDDESSSPSSAPAQSAEESDSDEHALVEVPDVTELASTTTAPQEIGVPLGIQLVRIPRTHSRYEKGRNKAEARVIVDQLSRIVHEHPDYSLGIVAFGTPQQTLIEDLVEARRAADPVLDARFDPDLEEPIFIKNLETVQGDERDIILFSVTYGPDEAGQLRLHLGPLQQLGGERRLNVAFTRARYHIRLVASLSGRDIDPERAQSLGARRLKEYLDYAESGGRFRALPLLDEGEEAARDAKRNATLDAMRRESAVRNALAEHLERRGYTVHHQIGQGLFRVDLAVVHPRHPHQYVLGIETDGATYRALPTARDRERTRCDMLAQLGWNLERVWSRDFFERPEEVVEHLVHRVEQYSTRTVQLPRPESGLASRRLKPSQRSSGANSKEEREALALLESQQASPRRLFATYHEAKVAKPEQVTQIGSASTEQLGTMIREIVEIEGPIHRELLQTRLKTIWDLRARTKAVQDAIARAIDWTLKQGQVRLEEPFLWPVNRNRVRPRIPAEGATPRDIQHIPEEELEGLLIELVRAAMSVPADELVSTAAQTLGFARAGSKIRKRLDEILEATLTQGKLTRTKTGALVLPSAPALAPSGEQADTANDGGDGDGANNGE